jgi:hypothetical protein
VNKKNHKTHTTQERERERERGREREVQVWLLVRDYDLKSAFIS